MHKTHTECAIRQMLHIDDGPYIRCPTCEASLVSETLAEEANNFYNEEARHEVIRTMWESEPDFKEDLIKVRQARTTYTRAHAEAGKKGKELLAKLQEEMEPILDVLRQRVRAAKQAFASSDESKADARALSSLRTKQTRVYKKWGVSWWSVRNALRGIAAARGIVGLPHYFYGRSRTARMFDITVK
jgi:hypothetical protein